MSRFLDPYYFVNIVMLLLFLLLRLYFVVLTPEGSAYGRLHSLQEFTSWERQSMATVLAVITWKGLRRRSWDHFAQQFFFYGKVVVALTAFMVDVRLFAWYTLAAWACFVAFPQPLIALVSGSDQDNIVVLNPTKMKDFVLKGDESWLVYFYTENHDESIAMAPAFAEVADKYTSDKLHFGCMDACLYRRFSKDLKLSTNTWGNQLPAVIMYSKGQEQGRIPLASQLDDLGIKKNYYTKADVIKKFKLGNEGLTAAGPNKAAAAAAAPGKAGQRALKAS